MADYVGAIDDSGGIEKLVRGDGSFIKGDNEFVVLSAIFIRAHLLDSFNQQWNDLRNEIKDELGCDHLPAIHMRLMWGKNVKKKHRRRDNPFVTADFETQIKVWVSRALEIIHDFNSEARRLNYLIMSNERKIMAEPHTKYFQTPRFRAEMEFIKYHSRGNKMYSHYHNRITSPLLNLFTNLLPHLDEAVRGARKTISLMVDQFSDSHGVDAVEIIDAIRSIGGLTNIRSVERVIDQDETPLCQAADVIAYIAFRRLMIAKKYISPDPHLDEIVNRFKLLPFTRANLSNLLRRRHENWHEKTMTVHYAIARQQIVRDSPSFADAYMISISEFLDRAIEASKAGEEGILVLKDWSVCKPFYDGLIK